MTTLQIGNATLILADCASVLPQIGPVDVLVSDPPYLFDAAGGGRYRRQRHAMDDIEDAGLNEGFDINIINPALYKSIVMFCHNDQLADLLPWYNEHYDRHALCLWRKTNPMPVANKHYQPEIEVYVHAWNKGAHPVGELKDKKRVVDHQVGKSPFDHPTVKPLPVMEKIMRNVNGDTVIDPFMGTGTTGLAALKFGKKFIGIERNPKFFNIACYRFITQLQDACAATPTASS